MGNEKLQQQYDWAKEEYAKYGVNVDDVLKRLADVKISMHCWQGDDVTGFMNPNQELTGGISVTGNYPGAARTPEQLRQDLEKAF